MTIEEKAKAYDEAIRKAKITLGCCDSASNITEHTVYDIFPELKESADDKIRKGIKSVLKHYKESGEIVCPYPFVSIDEALAWLEKQENCEYIRKDWLEHIEQSWYKEGFIYGKYSDETSKEWTINDAAILNELIDFLENGTAKLQHDLTKYANWLKIQFTPIEEQGGKNSTDKVEPKFKIGDWIVNNGHSYLIADIDYWDNRYLFEIGGYTHEQLNWEYIEDVDGKYHLWTIEDAKDGDILNDANSIFIFKDLLSDNSVVTYCDYDTDSGESDAFCPLSMDLMCSKITPATKEQRDLLFKKMKEDGYEWDDNKKELKKIEQKSVDRVKPKFRVGDTMRTRQEASDGITDGLPVVVSIDEEYYHCNNELIAIKDQDDYEYPPMNRKQNTAWSEEDEHRIDDTIYFIETAKKHYASTVELDACIDWLKSLKDRYVWKPSDEQVKALEHFVRSIGESGYASPYENDTKLLYSLLNDLKKLKA